MAAEDKENEEIDAVFEQAVQVISESAIGPDPETEADQEPGENYEYDFILNATKFDWIINHEQSNISFYYESKFWMLKIYSFGTLCPVK